MRTMLTGCSALSLESIRHLREKRQQQLALSARQPSNVQCGSAPERRRQALLPEKLSDGGGGWDSSCVVVVKARSQPTAVLSESERRRS
eukprot:365226-Chlamydomonas_euryale.AAC.1